jgi:hypothetical protein
MTLEELKELQVEVALLEQRLQGSFRMLSSVKHLVNEALRKEAENQEKPNG